MLYLQNMLKEFRNLKSIICINNKVNSIIKAKTHHPTFKTSAFFIQLNQGVSLMLPLGFLSDSVALLPVVFVLLRILQMTAFSLER